MAEASSARPLVNCWVVTDGSVGMENQCLGLADALGLEACVKRISRRPYGGLVPPQLLPPRIFLRSGHDAREEARIEPPWPDLLISCGRTSVGYAIAIRRASGRRTFTVHIQDPHLPTRYFDLVAPPRHDGLTGSNVIVTQGAIHRVTPERLREAARRFGPALETLPRPLVAVLIGGPNRRFRLSVAHARSLAEKLRRLAGEAGAGFAVTPSRRTPPEVTAILRETLAETSAVFWDGAGENPYFSYLALADAIVVTCDSISMISEACATGKPVYIAELEGGGSKRFERFYQSFRTAGMIRRFTGALESWSYTPLNEAARVAEEVRRRLARP